jgi:predicted nuclease with TOPRIM domain
MASEAALLRRSNRELREANEHLDAENQELRKRSNDLRSRLEEISRKGSEAALRQEIVALKLELEAKDSKIVELRRRSGNTCLMEALVARDVANVECDRLRLLLAHERARSSKYARGLDLDSHQIQNSPQQRSGTLERVWCDQKRDNIRTINEEISPNCSIPCGGGRSDCELGSSALIVDELRERIRWLSRRNADLEKRHDSFDVAPTNLERVTDDLISHVKTVSHPVSRDISAEKGGEGGTELVHESG